jgi:hypothetical protein
VRTNGRGLNNQDKARNRGSDKTALFKPQPLSNPAPRQPLLLANFLVAVRSLESCSHAESQHQRERRNPGSRIARTLARQALVKTLS